MKKRLQGLLAVLLAMTVTVPALADQTVRLNSGRSVDVMAIGPMISTHGWSALMLKYRTATPLTQMDNLRLEADELWEHFVVNVDAGRYDSAIVSANEPPQGIFIQQNDGYNFIFKKFDGSWRTLEVRERVRLDRACLVAFMARLDWDNDHNDLNALMLYMANDWHLKITDGNTPNAASAVSDRAQFVALSRAVLGQAKGYRHHRDILDVVIDKSGLTGRVVSRETTQMNLQGHDAGDAEHSVDSFQLLGGVMLWKKSESVIEPKPR